MSAPHKSECPVAAGQYAKDQNTNDLDFPTGQRQRKDESTVIARLALAGHVVHRGTCCDYIVCKYGLSYYAQDVESLQAFARRLGVGNV